MTAWIDTVAAKLRAALAHAAAGEPFDWDQLGEDQWPAGATDSGATLIAMAHTAKTIRQVMEWDDDVFFYGLPNARALQDMAQTTPYTRRQWIDAWTHSTNYKRATNAGRQPVLAEWLDPMRRILPAQTLSRAARALDMIQGFSYLGDVLLDAAKSIAILAAILKPRCPHGPTACSCRPAPFPAARDYQRRTKHRRRRQR